MQENQKKQSQTKKSLERPFSAKVINDFTAKIDQIKFDNRGLVPVIAQSEKTKEVLMLAWVNKQALLKSFTTGLAHYYSRSRRDLWQKGETSGNIQEVKKILLDCDHDAVLYLVKQKGPACHTGARNCFFNEI